MRPTKRSTPDTTSTMQKMVSGRYVLGVSALQNELRASSHRQHNPKEPLNARQNDILETSKAYGSARTSH